MPPPPKLPRIETGVAWFDEWIETIVSAIERALTINATPPIEAKSGPDGTHLRFTGLVFAHAKSGGSGIPAMSGSTPGSDDVTLYHQDETDDLVTQNVTVKAYNMSGVDVGADKNLILAMIDNRWFVIVEGCTP